MVHQAATVSAEGLHYWNARPTRLAPTSSSACRSQLHTFVQTSKNSHRPTHATGSMPWIPWPIGSVVDHVPAPTLLSEESCHSADDPVLVGAVVDLVRVYGPTVANRWRGPP